MLSDKSEKLVSDLEESAKLRGYWQHRSPETFANVAATYDAAGEALRARILELESIVNKRRDAIKLMRLRKKELGI